MGRPFILGVAGGSGSGKTTLAQKVCKHFGEDIAHILLQDYYYHDQSDRFDGDGGSVNFDHPDAIDFDRLAKDLQVLKEGQDIEAPIYDFVTHTRQKKTLQFKAKPLIVLDGILILTKEKICELLDLSVYVDTPEPIRFERRLNRDVRERGREPEGVKRQYERQVLPMHNQFVEPSKDSADRIVSDGDECFAKVLRELESALKGS